MKSGKNAYEWKFIDIKTISYRYTIHSISESRKAFRVFGVVTNAQSSHPVKYNYHIRYFQFKLQFANYKELIH